MNGSFMSQTGAPERGGRAPGEKATHADNPKNVVNSVVKAFGVLQAFSAARPALTITEISEAAGIDRGTGFRLIHTLVALGYLRPVHPKRFRLTVKCMELGFVAMSSQETYAEAHPLLSACVPELCDAASLGSLEGADVVYIARAEQGLDRYNIDRRPGRRVRAYGAALGHVILAYLPRAQQIAVLESAERVKLSERTLTDIDALLARFETVRQQGYAVSDGENAFGLRTLAVPILDDNGDPLAGISFTVQAQRMSVDSMVASILPRAAQIAAEIRQAASIRARTRSQRPGPR